MTYYSLNRHSEVYEKHYERLEGFTVHKFMWADVDDEISGIFPMLVMRRGDEQIRVLISQDQEMNLGGWLEIIEKEEDDQPTS